MEPNPYQTPIRIARQKQLHIEEQPARDQHSRIRASEVARKVKSFDHFLHIWGTKGGYYMPPKSALTWHYVSQILAGEKLLLRLQSVGHVQEVPKAKGLLVGAFWDECKLINDLHLYFPDITPQSHVTRTYFYNVG